MNNTVDQVNSTNGLVTGLKIFAGTMAVIYIAWHIWNVWLSPEGSFDPKVLRTAFMTLGFIVLYTPVMNLVDGGIGLLIGSVENSAESMTNTNNIMLAANAYIYEPSSDYIDSRNESIPYNEEYENMINETLLEGSNGSEENTETSSWNIVTSVTNLSESIENLGDEIMMSAIKWIANVIVSIFVIIRGVILHILYILGPMAAAISLMPGLDNSFKKWFGAYVNVSLWLAVSYIIQGVLIATMQVSLQSSSWLASASGGAVANGLEQMGSINGSIYSADGSGLLALVNEIALIAMFLFIPKITGYLVDSTGSALGAVSDRMYSKGKRGAGSAVSNMSRVATGGKSKIIGK